VKSFNDAVGSFQSRVMPAARRFRELGVVGKDELRDTEPVDSVPREISNAIAEDGRSAAPPDK
jgi:DNA recombination protein RmuC